MWTKVHDIIWHVQIKGAPFVVLEGSQIRNCEPSNTT
jgi:hypothetical protein